MKNLFDSNFFLIFISLIVVLFIQYHLAYKQMASMNKVARSYFDRGFVFAVGRAKGWIRKINLLVVTDRNGKIFNAEILDGITVFARYKDYPKFNGKKIDEILLSTTNTRSKSNLEKKIDCALRDACEQIRDYFNNQKGEALE